MFVPLTDFNWPRLLNVLINRGSPSVSHVDHQRDPYPGSNHHGSTILYGLFTELADETHDEQEHRPAAFVTATYANNDASPCGVLIMMAVVLIAVRWSVTRDTNDLSLFSTLLVR